MIKNKLRLTYLLGFILICCMLAGVAYLQARGFNPCPLCILQRYTLSLLGLIFLLGALFKLRKWNALVIGCSAILISALGIFLAGRQAWLQHLPNPNHVDCGASLEYMLQVLPWKQVLSNVLQGSAECSQVEWQFLNLSLADWSLIGFTVLLIIGIWQSWRATRL